MPKIEIKINKKLKLKTVLNKNINNINLQIIQVEISKFINLLKTLRGLDIGIDWWYGLPVLSFSAR